MKMEKEIAYIAGKVTGCSDYRVIFAQAAMKLEKAGYKVINPSVLPDGLEYDQYMSITGEMLKCATVIFLLPNWTESGVAKTEVCQAIDMNLKIIDFEQWLIYESESEIKSNDKNNAGQ